MNWQIYIIRTAQDTLYTGISTDVARRLAEHEAGKGARSLRGRGPLTLEFCREAGDRSLAQSLEARVKKLSRAQKEALISGQLSLPELPGA